MTLAIAHRNSQGRVVLDCVREIRAPFDPAVAVQDFVTVLRSYRLRSATSDYYGGEWVISAFRAHQIEIRTSDKPKSDIYRTLVPLLTSGSAELLDVPTLRAQFLSLERRTGRSGKEIIDHPPRQRDDLVNSAAGAIVEAHTQAVRGPAVAAIKNEDRWQYVGGRSIAVRAGENNALRRLHSDKRERIRRDLLRPQRSNQFEWMNEGEKTKW